jgi:uncharacterized membrane protein
MDLLPEIGWFAGWVLGVIGFFRALSAHAELRRLRAILAQQAAAQQAAIRQAAVQQTGGQPPAPAPAAAEPQLNPAPVASVPVFQPSAPPLPPPTPKLPARDLEALITTNWAVWLGSAALLFAGVFLVRYAVEQELLGPAARCTLAALLGLALLAGAEFLHRHEGPPLIGPFRIDHAPSGLAAGGTAVLFGAAYGAGPFFNLLPPLLAFAAMAVASLIALVSALRYGPLTAATGIAGAFITPALVATQDPSLPGLFAYLLLVSAAALLVVRQTAWTWLGWATTVAGAAWVCFAALPDTPDRWAAATFVAAAAALNLLLLPAEALDHPIGRRLAWIPFATLGIAGLILQAFDPGIAPQAALFMLAPIAIWKGATEPRLDRLPWPAALFGLLTLLIWSLPSWKPTGEVILADGIVQAILPGAWAPEAIVALITTAALFAAFHAAAGLWFERRAPNPLPWAALVAAVPVLTLTVAYARITRFQTEVGWAAAALVLTAALTATAAASTRENNRQRAGVHAAGAVAALALGCAMLLQDYWLTLAVALFLPPLAWIEARAELPALRPVALTVATLVIVRLAANWYVLDYAFGTMPLANGLVAGYAFPAASFAFAAVQFRRRGGDTLVATLEAGAVAFLSLFVALEIRHWTGNGHLEGPGNFTEIALHLLTIAIQATAYLYLAQRTGRPVLRYAWQILGTIALVEAVAVLLLNPMATGAPAEVPTLLAAYLAPACLAVLARRIMPVPDARTALGAYAVVAGFAWITLQIRQFFHPGGLGFPGAPIEDAELWAWSGGWLAYGIGLMAQGIRTSQRLLRLTALGVIGLVCAKVFVIDMSGLTGLWRVLSFLGLGLALIGLGVVYRRFVLPAQQAQAE